MDAEQYLLQVVRYIHRNPVKARMVTDPKCHRWSSHRHYLGEDHVPEGLVTEEVLGRFHQRRAQAIEQLVMETYGISKEKLRSKQRGFWDEPRNLAIYLGRMVGGYRLVEMGRRWGDLQYSSVSWMAHATRRLMQEDRNFFRRAKTVEDSLLKSQM